MQRRSPPKHRHDGTSPLPLGMDWSPPPRKLNGRDIVWPHDHRTGWSYCLTIPSWVVLPKSRASDPVVFYRVQVAVQSPEGIPTIRGVLRRFNDFLKLFSDLKKSYPKKNLPPPPPKGLLRLKSRTLLEERRSSLEEWMTKLLSDIDLSRSVSVAVFFELEAAARSSFRDVSQQSPETILIGNGASPLQQMPPHSSSSLTAGSSSVTSDYGSDTAYETSELGMRDDSFDFGIEDPALDEDLMSPIDKLVKYGMSNIDEGLFMGQTILDQLEGIPRHKPQASYVNNVMETDVYRGNSLRTSSVTSNDGEIFSRSGLVIVHSRKLSSESVGSDGSSLRGSEISNSGISNSGIPNSSGDGSADLLAGSELFSNTEIINCAELQSSGDVQIVVPIDQRYKMNRVLQNMQRRLVSAKTDMEDLISRLNQEMAVKEYLATKVKDLEVELEASRQRNKENLQQAIVIEREKLTQMQWDMEELRRKSLEIELKLKSKEDGQPIVNLEVGTSNYEKDETSQELEVARRQLDNLSKQYEELEAKSKADIKFLAKEFKSLKSSHTELKQEFGQLKENKSEIEKLLREEREARNQDKIAREKLLHGCRTLCNQFQACDLDFSHKDDDLSIVYSSLEDTLEALSASEKNFNLVLSEIMEDGKTTAPVDETRTDDDLRMVLAKVFSLDAKLRKQVTSVMIRALQKGTTIHKYHEEAPVVKINHVENINNY